MDLLVLQSLFSSQISVLTGSGGLLKNGNLKGAVWCISAIHMQDWIEQYMVLWLNDAVEQKVGNISMKF